MGPPVGRNKSETLKLKDATLLSERRGEKALSLKTAIRPSKGYTYAIYLRSRMSLTLSPRYSRSAPRILVPFYFFSFVLSRRQIRNKFVGNASSYLTSSGTIFDFHVTFLFLSRCLSLFSSTSSCRVTFRSALFYELIAVTCQN